MNPMWKVYKSKVMKTLNPDLEDEEDPVEEVCEPAEDMTPIQGDEGPSTMTQLAKRMQGAGAKGWKSVSSLFTKEDEHQLLEAENQPAADHPLAVKPEEPPRPSRRSNAFWDSFATKWHQAAAARQAEAGGAEQGPELESGAAAQEEGQEGQGEGQEGEGQGNSFSKYATLGGEDAPAFKWNFVTSKLAELKTKSMAKSN